MQVTAVLEFARGVLVNLFVLFAFVALCAMARGWTVKPRRPAAPWHTGLLAGVTAVFAMLFPVVLRTGMIFDCRAGVIGAAALLGGPVTALVSLPLPLAYRIGLGGTGAVPGVFEIALPALWGTLCHVWLSRRRATLTMKHIIVSSLVVGAATNGPIFLYVSTLLPAGALELGPLGVVLVLLNTAVAMSLVGALVLAERRHYEAVIGLADSERRMRHSQKMAAIGQLAGTVAHNFTNALTQILGNAELAQKQPDTPPHVKELMEGIIGTVERMSRLTGELLAFANPNPLRVRRMDLSKCTGGIRELLAKALGPRVEVVIDAGRPAGLVDVDPDQVEQAVVHMAVNAAEAMPDGGRLTVAVSHATLSQADVHRLQVDRRETERHEGEYAVLSVTDTGHGMTEEVRSRIFEPFFTTRKAQGNVGLGLSTVYNIVQLHNACIEIDSRPAAGTTFRIYFPIAE